MLYYIQTFGCQMNEHDSALLASLLESAGHQPIKDMEQADIIIVNTCCVRQSAENKAYGFIGNLKKYKEANPALVIAVCGCMAQKSGVAETWAKKARHVGIFLGTFAFAKLPQYVEEYRNRGERIIDTSEQTEAGNTPQALPIVGELPFKAQISIIHGCNNFCTYCIVPYVRGQERSRNPKTILQEAYSLVQGGVKEIQLLGQNVNSYGKDFVTQDWNFARLLRELDKIEGLMRVRYMTSHPRDFSQELIETIAASQHICHHFHLPIQSGCNKQLKTMNRGYTTGDYAKLLENIRHLIPDATITSDLIVGFPGETGEDFLTTLDFITQCNFDTIYTFLYSQRTGTPAAEMVEQIDLATKKERLQQIMQIQNPISLAKNQKLAGQTQLILLEGPSKNNPQYWSGRNDANKIVVVPARPGFKLGDAITLKITAAQTWNLFGEEL